MGAKMSQYLKLVVGVIFLSIFPMLGHYIHSSVGMSAFIFGTLMIIWGFIDAQKYC